MKPPGGRGVTLIDTLVSTALMLVVFVGIGGAFKLSIEVVTNNKARAGALALANERMEYIRSLPYDQVAVVGGIPAGAIPATEEVELNGITYTRRTIVIYGDDPKDGIGALDANHILTDYKQAKTEVSWQLKNGTRRIYLISRVSPLGLETAAPGGVLFLSIVNAIAQPVSGALVRIINTSLVPPVDLSLFSDDRGEVTVIGAPPGAGYAVVITKSGHNTAQTYTATAQNTNPTPGHLTIADGQTTSVTFPIDLVGTKNIRSFGPNETDTWTDSFADATKLSDVVDTEVIGGAVQLTNTAGTYVPNGTARSITITPTDLVEWDEFRWTDTKPAQTNVLYRVYTGDGSALIPDAQLPGNSTGLAVSPINLSGISTTTYPTLSMHATLGTVDTSVTPEINSWNVSYEYGPVPLPNLVFSLQGLKTIGSGPSGLIFKYSTTTLSTGATAGMNVANLEWDTYTISVNGASTGYDIASSCAPQPEALVPGDYQSTLLHMVPHTTNSFLVDVRSSAGVVIPEASVRLYRGAYDTTKNTDGCGYTHFNSLSSGSPGGGNPYSLDVSASGFQSFSASDVTVSGTSKLSIVLNSL
jgi:hypothetical protein